MGNSQRTKDEEPPVVHNNPNRVGNNNNNNTNDEEEEEFSSILFNEYEENDIFSIREKSKNPVFAIVKVNKPTQDLRISDVFTKPKEKERCWSVCSFKNSKGDRCISVGMTEKIAMLDYPTGIHRHILSHTFSGFILNQLYFQVGKGKRDVLVASNNRGNMFLVERIFREQEVQVPRIFQIQDNELGGVRNFASLNKLVKISDHQFMYPRSSFSFGIISIPNSERETNNMRNLGNYVEYCSIKPERIINFQEDNHEIKSLYYWKFMNYVVVCCSIMHRTERSVRKYGSMFFYDLTNHQFYNSNMKEFRTKGLMYHVNSIRYEHTQKRYLVTISKNSSPSSSVVHVWDYPQKRIIKEFITRSTNYQTITFQNFILSSSKDGIVNIFDLESPNSVLKPIESSKIVDRDENKEEIAVYDLSWIEEGKSFTCSSADGTVRFIRVLSGEGDGNIDPDEKERMEYLIHDFTHQFEESCKEITIDLKFLGQQNNVEIFSRILLLY